MLIGRDSVASPLVRFGGWNVLGLSFAAALLAGGMSNAHAQNQSSVHWTNNAGQDAATTLKSGASFVTSFKQTDDVTIALLSGSVGSYFSDAFGGAYAYDNPWYLTSFVGSAATGTGDGVAGDIGMLETSRDGTKSMALQFDFSSPLTPRDHLLVADVDNGERYGVEAYVRSGSAYTKVSLTNWGSLNCAGHTQQWPDSTWPTWDSTNGLLTSPGLNSTSELLVVLTPAQNIDRVIFYKYPAGPNGSAYIQFLTEPRPTGKTTLNCQSVGANLLVSWPQASSNLTLYSSITLGNDWLPVTNNPPVLRGGSWVVTNAAADLKRFYRLQWP